MSDLFVGVDVGTRSARAGVFDKDGTLLGSARHPIQIWHGEGGLVEQSSNDIWAAVCACVREASRRSGADPARIAGIGFDATCSLVVLDAAGGPLAVGPSGDRERNVVVWMDHRAVGQSDRINALGHGVLAYVGGAISPEMQTPKLLWLKENRPATFREAGDFFDLADYLSFRATGSRTRSVCTTTCKWTYLAHEARWDEGYFRAIGLGELADERFRRIGTRIVDVGAPLGRGLTGEAASALGLLPGTVVGASLIDAHAGALGTLAGRRPDGSVADPTSELALVMGTSACVMAVTPGPLFVPGAWGPYHSALLPGAWLIEGGHSAYGAAIDHLVDMHPAADTVRDAARSAGLSVLDHLEGEAVRLAGSVEDAARLAADLHVVPEFLGNRSPDADPHATAILAGLRLDATPGGLAGLFVAGLCGLCYGTREIVASFRAAGLDVGTIVVSGGASRSGLLRRILADATDLRVRLPSSPEPVLLGSSMLGAVASGAFPDLKAAAAAMGRTGEDIQPNPALAAFHERKRDAYAVLKRAEREVRALQTL